ncbi:MAG TPA: rhomboid family intramembrane serine protease [Anaeromyxobacter sp.]|nr:rhomboid family intramembrane serine protease [Anaeromyxobacter sp.]
MLIPIGLDNVRLSRLPYVSLGIAVLCLVAFAASAISSAEAEAKQARSRAIEYLVAHPYLEPPQILIRRLAMDPARLRPAPEPPGLTEENRRSEQARLEELSDELAAAQDATPVYRFSVVPSRGALQVGWLTHLFMHGGIGHLAGNMLIFLLIVGPFLEDAWGPLFFAGFYLVGGVAAALFQVPNMHPDVPLLGASGAISACLGAFALRFAHRRVRMLFFLLLFVVPVFRRQFFVPAWLYALGVLALDLVGLALSDGRGGVAYAAHVGGFLFGAGVAVAVAATRFERRIAPEGAVRWRSGLDLNRAAEALAEGDVSFARTRLLAALKRESTRDEAAVELARIEARSFNAGETTELLEPVLARRIAAGDAGRARALLAEFRGGLRADRFRPGTAYRVAELAAREDPEFALSLYEAAGAAGGGLGAKALLKAAQGVRAADPERARELLDRAEGLAADGDVANWIRLERGTLPPPRSTAASEWEVGRVLPEGAALGTVWCRVAGIHGATLDLVTPDGRTARLEPARVALASAALLDRLVRQGEERKNGVVLDLLLHPRQDGSLLLLRLAGHEMNLAGHRPGVPTARAYAQLVEALLLEGGGSAWPDAAGVQGRPFRRFSDLAAYEEACFGRVLTS